VSLKTNVCALNYLVFILQNCITCL